LLHGLRRRRILARLQARGIPGSILVVCYGNLCRSPYAAGRLRKQLPTALASNIRVDSAGFFGPNRPPPAEAVTVAGAHGVDLSQHRSQLLGPREAAAADLILVMEPAQQDRVCGNFGRWRGDVVVLGDLDPEPITGRAILDPVEQPVSVFEESYARIDRCLRALISVMSSAVPAR
jgi:protein-tyrosine phosphatase